MLRQNKVARGHNIMAWCLAVLSILFSMPALASTTETYDTNTGSGANPYTYNAFKYSYRNSGGSLISDVLWVGSVDLAAHNSAGLETDSGGVGGGHQLDIERSAAGTFTFYSIGLTNYTAATYVYFKGYNSAGTEIYSQSVLVDTTGQPWTTFTPGSAWTGLSKLSIISASAVQLDPYLDDFSYDLTTAASAPTASTVAASSIAATSATLNGTVTANGAATTVTFKYGADTNYGSTIAATPSPLSSSAAATSVSAALTGLACNTTYHYVVYATNTAGSATGSDTIFTTSACVPDAPTIGTATAGVGQAAVAFTAPTYIGASAITGYTAISTPDSKTGTGTSSPITVSGLTNGTVYTFTVTATNANGTSVASAASNAVTPKATQTITFNSVADQDFGTTPTLTASSGAALSVSFTSGTTSVCTITGTGVLAFITAGTCTINADQAGNAAWAAATTVTRSFTVKPIVPGAPAIGTATTGDTQASVSFTAPTNTGGTSISSYRVTSSGGQIVTGIGSPLTVTGLTNGTSYTFTVQAYNSVGWGTASSTSNAVTPKGSQTITFNSVADQDFGTTPTLTATSSAALSVSFTSGTTSVCTITSGGGLSFLSAGTCTINADQAGNAAWGAAPTVTRSFTVKPIVPGAPAIGTATTGDTQASVSFTAPTNTGGAAISNYRVTSSAGQTATGTSSPITVAGLTNGVAYTFTVQAYNSAGYGSASGVSNSVTPNGNQAITFTQPANQNFGTTPTLTATAPGGAVTFSSSTTSVCSITSGGLLTFVTAGTCTIKADQAGGGAYLAAATVTRSFSVLPVVPGAPSIGTATAGAAQATVTFTAPTFTGGSSITSYTVTSNPGSKTGTGTSSPITVLGLSNGTPYTFTVTATTAAGTSAASDASNAVTPKATQTITFNSVAAQDFGTTPTLTATTSATGLSVTFTSSTTSVCTITSAGVLTFLAAGTCTINADQAGNSTWAAATTVTQSFAVKAVAPGAPTIGTATAGNTQATVAFTAPTYTGATAITSYTVTSNPGNITATGTSSPITINGLTNNTAYTFTVKATNSVGTGAASAASNSVTPRGAPPVANATSASVAYASSANIITPNLGGGTAISLTIASQPAHGTASVSGLTLIYTPVATYSGSDTFTYTGTNAGGTSSPATVTVTVNPQAPIAGTVSMKVEVSSANNVVPLALTGGAAASVALSAAPVHGTATVSGKVITYTPVAGYSGNDSFNYTATNAGGTSAAATVTILVQSRPDPSKDAEVNALLTAQVDAAKRFAEAQITNFQTHLEGLHSRSKARLRDDRTLSSRNPAVSTDAMRTPALEEFGVVTLPAKNASAAVTAKQPGTTGYTPCQITGNVDCISAGAGGLASGDHTAAELAQAAGTQSLSSLLPWQTLNLAGKTSDPFGYGLEMWSAGTINTGWQSTSDTRFNTAGISVGTDTRVSDTLIVGIGAGFGHERQTIGDNDTRDRVDGYSLVAYLSYQPEDGYFIDGLIGYGQLNFDAQRYVTTTGGYAQSQRDGVQWFTSITGGYEYLLDKTLLSPYGRLDLISTRLKRSTESGAGIYDLVYAEQTTPSTKLALGVRGETVYLIDNGALKPNFRVEYQHEFANPGVADIVYADQLLGTVYQLEMSSVDRDALSLGMGLEFEFKKGWSGGLSYRFGHSTSSSSQSNTLGVLLRRSF